MNSEATKVQVSMAAERREVMCIGIVCETEWGFDALFAQRIMRSATKIRRDFH
jgi:hypothetical protein